MVRYFFIVTAVMTRPIALLSSGVITPSTGCLAIVTRRDFAVALPVTLRTLQTTIAVASITRPTDDYLRLAPGTKI